MVKSIGIYGKRVREEMKIGSLNPQMFMFDNGDKSLHIKSPTLWGVEDGKVYPLIYFRKPKYMTQEDFEILMGRIEITIKGEAKKK